MRSRTSAVPRDDRRARRSPRSAAAAARANGQIDDPTQGLGRRASPRPLVVGTIPRSVRASVVFRSRLADETEWLARPDRGADPVSAGTSWPCCATPSSARRALLRGGRERSTAGSSMSATSWRGSIAAARGTSSARVSAADGLERRSSVYSARRRERNGPRTRSRGVPRSAGAGDRVEPTVSFRDAAAGDARRRPTVYGWADPAVPSRRAFLHEVAGVEHPRGRTSSRSRRGRG